MESVRQVSDLTTHKEFQVSLHGQAWPPASASPMPSPQTRDIDRFMCIAYLLIDVGSKVWRKLFNYHAVTPTCTLDQYLAKNKYNIEMLYKQGSLNGSQLDIMFPRNGDDTNLDDYDIPLLSILFKNIVPSLGRWERIMIKSLQDDRYSLYVYAKSCKMNAIYFRTCWEKISSTLITLSQQCEDHTFENEIRKKIQQTRVPDASYLSIIRAWYIGIDTAASVGPMPSPPASDRDRFISIAYLLIDVGTRVLRKLFYNHVVTPTFTLNLFLANNRRTIKSLCSRRLLNSFQMDIMFPRNGNDTNLDDYDIRLLSVLLNRIVPSLSYHEKSLIKSLQDDRNNLYIHAKSCKMNASDFQTYWNSISATLITLTHQCGGPDFETEISKEIQQTRVPDVPVIPMEILHMDERSLQVYKEALRDGKEKVYNIRVMVVGHYGVGKTTLIKRLLEQQVDISGIKSTEGIDVHKHCCKVVLATGEWNVQLEDSDQMTRLQRLMKLLTGQTERIVGSIEQDGQIDVIYKREMTTEDFHSPVHDIDDYDDIRTSSVSSTDPSAVITSKQIENLSLVRAGQEQESDERDGKGDATMEFLKLVNEKANKLNMNMVEFALLSLWDFAGQFVFYTTHQTFLTCRAIYLLVTDLSKQVTDLVKDDDCFIDAEGVRLCQVQDLVEIWFNSIHCCASFPTTGDIPSSWQHRDTLCRWH